MKDKKKYFSQKKREYWSKAYKYFSMQKGEHWSKA
jgi:phosphoribosyl-AMP cyclohydrolase